MIINLHFLTSLKKNPIPKARLKKINEILCENFQQFLNDEFKSEFKFFKKLELTIYLAGSNRVKALNSKYRQKNKTTDVLSFPVVDHLIKEVQKEKLPEEFSLGDIVIDWKVCQKQSKDHQLEPWLELIYLIHHGFLHLLGFDHEKSKKEEKMMQEMEDLLFEGIKKKLKVK